MYFSPMARQSPLGLVLLYEVSRQHSNTPHSVGLLWTSDRPIAETSTRQHSTDERQKSHHPNKTAAANPRLRRRGDWYRLLERIIIL
jgi:hypothetical protein